MDQEAFRQLVSSSSAVSSSTGTRAFGKAQKRHPAPSTSSATKPHDLKPRKLKLPTDDTPYTDRASARRSGTLNSEFSDVEALHHDFEQRIAAAETEEERQKLRDQISSVGGDAKYSVLVKGLDWALLAQNKAKIERENGGVGDEVELESAYQEGKGDGSRSRDDIVDAIRRRREAKSAASTEKKSESTGAASGFRPIGFKPIGSGDKADENGAEYKWVNGKRMRKKKKGSGSVMEQSIAKVEGVEEDHRGLDRQEAKVANESIGAADAQINLPQSRPSMPGDRPSEKMNQKDPASASEPEEATPPVVNLEEDHITRNPAPSALDASTKTVPKDNEDDDEDEDIFADVGGWNGVPDTKEDEEVVEDDATPVPPAITDHTPPPPATAASEPIIPPRPIIRTSTPTLDTTTTASEATSEPHTTSLPAPATATSTADTAPPFKPRKKSKWDDDLDDDTAKKKKKKHC